MQGNSKTKITISSRFSIHMSTWAHVLLCQSVQTVRTLFLSRVFINETEESRYPKQNAFRTIETVLRSEMLSSIDAFAWQVQITFFFLVRKNTRVYGVAADITNFSSRLTISVWKGAKKLLEKTVKTKFMNGFLLISYCSQFLSVIILLSHCKFEASYFRDA